jgi:hypothetical protein
MQPIMKQWLYIKEDKGLDLLNCMHFRLYSVNLHIGPILISLDVPKKQYKTAPTKDVLKSYA